MNFYDKYLLLCNKRGERPTAVAVAVGSRGSVTRWKNGAMPTDSTLTKLADYFGVSIDELKNDVAPVGLTVPREGVTDTDIKAAFWGGDDELSQEDIDDLWDDAKAYIEFKTQQKKKGKKK